jgi:hypothetical protein
MKYLETFKHYLFVTFLVVLGRIVGYALGETPTVVFNIGAVTGFLLAGYFYCYRKDD